MNHYQKNYVSITKKSEFAAINIKKSVLRVGLDLGDMSYNKTVAKSKLTGPMARISHMTVIRSNSEINNNLFQLLDKANKRVNQ